MKYLRIVDWEKFQHYKKRNPPWVKLYSAVLDDDDFDCMPDDSKLLFFCLLPFASRRNNQIRLDFAWLQKKLPMRKIITQKTVQPLIDAGFVECYQDDSVVIEGCKQDATPETETETETEREGEQNVQETFLLFWNSQKDLPKIQSMSNARTKLLKTRMKNTVFMKEWKTSVVRLAASDFHTGKNDRQWKATVDWFLKNDTNWVKALELPDPQPPKPSRRKQEEMQQRKKAREDYTEYLTRATPEQVDMFRDKFPQHHWLVDEIKGKDRRGDD